MEARLELSQAFIDDLAELSKRHGLKLELAGWTSNDTIKCLHMLGEGAMYVTDSERDGNNIQLFSFQPTQIV